MIIWSTTHVGLYGIHKHQLSVRRDVKLQTRLVESLWTYFAMKSAFPLVFDVPVSVPQAVCLIFAAQLKRTDKQVGFNSWRWMLSFVQWSGATWSQLRSICSAAELSEAQKLAAKRGQDKWLWKVVAQYRQWFSMVHKYINGFFSGKKRKGVEAKFWCLW